jgi:phage shock protein A
VGIGKRIGSIIRANLDHYLTGAEDPEKQMDLALSDMQDALRQAKGVLIAQLAEEKRLQRELDQADEMGRVWEDKARRAVTAGVDDLAREALRKKRTYEDLASQLDGQLADQQKAVDDLRAQYKLLEKRIAEAQDRRRQLQAESVRRRPAPRGESTSARQVDTRLVKDTSAFDKFEEMADKVDRYESETTAQREIDDYLQGDDELARKIDSLGAPARGGAKRGATDRELEVDIELEDMRKRMGREAPPPPPPTPADDEPPARRSRRRERNLTLNDREAAEDAPDAAAPAAGAPPADTPAPKPDAAGEDEGDDDGPARHVEL